MFSFIASNTPGPKRQRPIGLPRGHSARASAVARAPPALGQEYMLGTKSATVALRNQMRLELAEVEEDTRRQAGHLCRAPARRGEFLLAASILVQRQPDVTVEDALALAQSQFVEQRVCGALQHIQEKWKLIFERPAEFQVHDQRQEELMLCNANILREEQQDSSEAEARVCKLCMFLTAGGKFLKEWKAAFAERAALKRNGGVWTPNQFAMAVVDIARDASGCKAPEGLAATIYDYMDTNSSRLVHIDEFFRLVRVGMCLEEKEKREKANTKARVEEASKAATRVLKMEEEEEKVPATPAAPEEEEAAAAAAAAAASAVAAGVGVEEEEEQAVVEVVEEGYVGNAPPAGKAYAEVEAEEEEEEYEQVFEDEAQSAVVATTPALHALSRTLVPSENHRSEKMTVVDKKPALFGNINGSQPPGTRAFSSSGEKKSFDAFASTISSETTSESEKKAGPIAVTPKPLRLDQSGWTEDTVTPHSPYVLSPVHNHVARRATHAVRGYRLEANDPDEHYTSSIAFDSNGNGNGNGNGGRHSQPRRKPKSTITGIDIGTPARGSRPNTPTHHSSSPWVRIMLHAWARAKHTLSPFRHRRLRAQLQEEKEMEQAEEKLRMQKEIESLRATLEQVCGDAAIRLAHAEAAKAAALEATRVAKAAEHQARQATERATQMAAEQQSTHKEQRAMAAAIQSAGFVVGQRVRARFAGRGHFYPATITGVLAQERYDILYADGDREKGVQKKHLRLILL